MNTLDDNALLIALKKLESLQQEVITLIQVEADNHRADISKESKELHKTFSKIPEYQEKVARIVKMMQSINNRIAKLKQRSTTIQTVSLKDAAD